MNTETKTSITKAHPISRGRKAGKILLEGKNQKGKEKKENKTSITKAHPISRGRKAGKILISLKRNSKRQRSRQGM